MCEGSLGFTWQVGMSTHGPHSILASLSAQRTCRSRECLQCQQFNGQELHLARFLATLRRRLEMQGLQAAAPRRTDLSQQCSRRVGRQRLGADRNLERDVDQSLPPRATRLLHGCKQLACLAHGRQTVPAGNGAGAGGCSHVGRPRL